jgi:hypothetical protein
MNLSKTTISVLVDLIENKLAVMKIGDREELREIVILQRCLGELHGLSGEAVKDAMGETPRGRRRKLTHMIEEYASELDSRRLA